MRNKPAPKPARFSKRYTNKRHSTRFPATISGRINMHKAWFLLMPIRSSDCNIAVRHGVATTGSP
ncbi:hypothetical protein VI26_06380 [Chromobacterium sp. LK1]|nr:hypothetical protein VI26_06380 [Chromobacterium sp. LK1]